MSGDHSKGMDQIEAMQILRSNLASYESLSYPELVSMIGNVRTLQLTAPSGRSYNIEVQIMWDDMAKRTLRILGAVDDGGLWHSMSPLTDDIIVYPPPQENNHEAQ